MSVRGGGLDLVVPAPVTGCLGSLVDAFPDAARLIDADTLEILDANHADQELSGYPRAALLGRDAREFWPIEPELRARVEGHVAEVRARGTARAFALPFRTRGGRLVPVDVHAGRAWAAGREVLVVLSRDATPRLAREAIQQEAAQLRAARAVANGAAHEINNPLSVISGSLELLARRVAAGSPEARWVARALEAAARVQEIVTHLDRIRAVERLRQGDGLGPALDLRRSSAAG